MIKEKTTQQQKILILAAIPNGLRLDREVREVEECIRRATKRDMFDVDIRTAVRPQDIRRAIAEEKPQIVHFCGHGFSDGSLLLEDDGGHQKPISPSGLASLFELHKDYVTCVLLNACYSVKSAEAISEYINYAIGINQEIQDKSAIRFAQGFYDGLGYEVSKNQYLFERAFKEGLVAIQLENLPQAQIPILKKKQDTEFFKLRNLLEAEEWKKADLETKNLILKAVGVSLNENITPERLATLPCSILHKIDKLWVELSNGNFGFSTQIDIYKSLGRNQLDWAKAVGWRHSYSAGLLGYADKALDGFSKSLLSGRAFINWVPYNSLQFTLNAPKGHLPSLGEYGYGSNGALPLLPAIESKLAEC